MASVPRLLAVSDRSRLGGDWGDWCAMLARSGVDGLQVREKDLDDRDLFELVCRARAAFPRPGALLVNRRFDIALAAGADGVHLPSDGFSTAAVVAATPPDFLVGRSTHEIDEVAAAAADGADYVVFGPILVTPSKLGRIAPRGVSSLRAAARCAVPVIAIGGLDPASSPEAIAAGAHGVAAIRALADSAGATAMVAAVLGRRERP